MGGLTYKDAGVDVDAGAKAVELMKTHVKRTAIEGVLGNIGSFGGLFQIPEGYTQPVLVTGTDGVGTKLQLAFMSDRHDTIGIDCVAMCVNDIVCQGATPLAFLDYIGCGKLEPTQAEQIVKGVADGCVEAGCALVGGETAEMPGFYKEGEYDLAGFSVGIVEKKKIISPEKVAAGDRLIGLPSSGLHSNGFSLVRKLFFERHQFALDHKFKELHHTLIEELMIPTKIYVKPLLKVLKQFHIHGIAHITGGGFYENIPRILPERLCALVDIKAFTPPPIFQLIESLGEISKQEMYSTFNMGVGMVLAVDKMDCDGVMNLLSQLGENPVLLGEVQKGNHPIVLE